MKIWMKGEKELALPKYRISMSNRFPAGGPARGNMVQVLFEGAGEKANGGFQVSKSVAERLGKALVLASSREPIIDGIKWDEHE